MSADATGHVYRHAPYSGATFAVLLAIADTVSDQWNNECWMSLHTISVKARVNRDTVRTSVQTLVADGWLECLEQSSGGKPSRYAFCFDDGRPVEWEGRARPNPHATRGSAAGPPGSNSRPSRGTPAGESRDTRGSAARIPNNLKDPNAPGRRSDGSRRRDVAAERAEARVRGEACETCFGSRFVLGDEDPPLAHPCPKCSPDGRTDG